MSAMLDRARLLTIARKEWCQLRRDARSLLLAFAVPLQLLLLFGYAITWDVRDIPTAVLDHDRSQASRSLVDAFRAAGYFRVVGELATPADESDVLARGRARVVIVIPVRFAADLAAGRSAPVQLLLDGSDANTATISLGYANAIAASWAPAGGGRVTVVPTGVVPETRVWYNESLESRKVLVPGLVAMIMMSIGSLLTALTIAREWERGTMEQLVATPVRPWEVVLGKLVPYLGIGMADVALTVTLGAVLFHVPFRGNPLLLLVAALAFLIGVCSIGIWISALAKSQRLAVQLSMLLTYLPGMLLSGAMFDLSTMPRALQALSWAIPARYFVVVLKGVLLKDVGFAELWPALVALVGFACVALPLALGAFRKELA